MWKTEKKKERKRNRIEIDEEKKERKEKEKIIPSQLQRIRKEKGRKGRFKVGGKSKWRYFDLDSERKEDRMREDIRRRKIFSTTSKI